MRFPRSRRVLPQPPVSRYRSGRPRPSLRPVTQRHRLSALALGIVLLSPLTACSGSGSSDGQPSRGSSVAPSSTVVNASFVQGVTQTSLQATTPRTVSAKVPQIATARNLSQAIEVVRERALRGASWSSASKITMTSSFIAASEDVVGVQIDTTTTTTSAQSARTTLWYDATLGQTFSSNVLISWPGWKSFRSLVGKAAADAGLDRTKALASLQQAQAPYGSGPALSFTSNGGMAVVFPAGAVGTTQASVTLDRKAVEPLLSDFGAKAQGASLHPSTFSGHPSTTRTWWTPAKDRPAPTSSPNLHPLPGDSTAGKDAQTTASASPSATASEPGSSGNGASSTATTPSTTNTAVKAPTLAPDAHPSTAVGIDCVANQCIALTYDDGPGQRTPELLKTFEGSKAAATFFELGTSIDERAETTKLVAASGFEIGNHSSTHPDLATVSTATVKTEVGGNSARLAKITGRRPMLMRPPYGDHNSSVDAVIAANGMAVVNWIVDTQDWQTKSASKTLSKILVDAGIYTGPIMLMHDIHDAAIDASAKAVPQLTAEGYQLVTVSELTVNTGGLQAGHGYCRGTALVQDGYLCKG